VRYKVNIGINYTVNGKDKRVEPGEEASDIPVQSLPWLLEQGVIEKMSEAQPVAQPEAPPVAQMPDPEEE
jgi:hypothetical protein